MNDWCVFIHWCVWHECLVCVTLTHHVLHSLIICAEYKALMSVSHVQHMSVSHVQHMSVPHVQQRVICAAYKALIQKLFRHT